MRIEHCSKPRYKEIHISGTICVSNKMACEIVLFWCKGLADSKPLSYDSTTFNIHEAVRAEIMSACRIYSGKSSLMDTKNSNL